jgi:tetratricopeptide (TPR) repeat protein
VAAALAAFWAVHPLRVESVAWISERKDVLSAFFGLLAVWCHCAAHRPISEPTPRPSQTPSRVLPLALTTLLMALSLLAKPMLVTLPALLLVLDYWPLRRRWSPMLLIEKSPLVILSLASAVVTVMAQYRGGAVSMLEHISVPHRLTNAVVAAAHYLWSTLNLSSPFAVIYPHPGYWPAWVIVVSAVSLACITVIAAVCRDRVRPLLAGWGWYLVCLAPVIGIVQVGAQSHADRYTYLPTVGLLLGLGGLLVQAATPVRSALVVGLAVASGLAAYHARIQSGLWADTFTVMQHTLRVTSRNPSAHNSLGAAWMDKGQPVRALEQFQQAVALRPNDPESHNNCANALAALGQFPQALSHYDQALKLRPTYYQALNNKGEALTRMGDLDSARQALLDSIRINPDFAPSHYNLGIVWANMGRLDQAMEAFRRSLAIDPRSSRSHNNLGVVLGMLGREREGLECFQTAVSLDASNVEALNNLAVVLANQGRLDTAIELLDRAIQVRPDYVDATHNLCGHLITAGRLDRAATVLQSLMSLAPDHPKTAQLLKQLNAARSTPSPP